MTAPDRLGFDPERLDKARLLLERAIADGAFPGAVALVARRGEVAVHWALGDAQVVPERRPMEPDTVFDLASLTKALAGATAALLLLEDGVWSLDDAVARFIPEFGANGKSEVTLRQLLSHSAGFGGWVAAYAHARDPEAALRYVCGLELTYAPGTSVSYSDVGMSLIGHLVRRVTGEGLDALLARRVWGPLRLNHTAFNPPVAWRPTIAATEWGNRYEREMVKNLGLTFEGWRDHVLVGEVNDGNTAYALGGVSSHAGLFSTALDLFRFANLYRGEGCLAGVRVLSPASVRAASSLQTAGLSQARGLGWQLVQKGRMARDEWAPSPAALTIFPASRFAVPAGRPYGDLLSGRAYGHTGFTGTSLVIDPAYDLAIVLLTNRVHPDAHNVALNLARPRFHNLVAASLVG